MRSYAILLPWHLEFELSPIIVSPAALICDFSQCFIACTSLAQKSVTENHPKSLKSSIN
jgi:hypothetical protein